ncbi:MAG: hypothetical protein M3R61_05455 [Chloroflexota bacterium]|nr:hypothetical protein [Chloroflexota bacterium]
MPPDNQLNTGKGRSFQVSAAAILAAHFGVVFQLDYPIAIGRPPKLHRFDLASTDVHYVGECKNYSWTESGNVPSAKMGFINEAVFYLSFLPAERVKFVVMRKDHHLRRVESVANYYYRTYQHLLNGIFMIEIDIDTGSFREIGRTVA